MKKKNYSKESGGALCKKWEEKKTPQRLKYGRSEILKPEVKPVLSKINKATGHNGVAIKTLFGIDKITETMHKIKHTTMATLRRTLVNPSSSKRRKKNSRKIFNLEWIVLSTGIRF